MHILAIEADADLAEMLKVYFREKGHQLTLVENVGDVSKLVKKVRPALITIDHNPPDIEGLEIARRLRESQSFHEIPVIMLINEREKVSIAEVQDNNIADLIIKPLALSKLDFLVEQRLHEVKNRRTKKEKTTPPEWLAVDNKLAEMQRQGSWGVVVAGLGGLNKFRDLYGNIAANDVAVAVNLIVRNAMKASGVEDAFVGTIGPADYAVITTAEPISKLASNCQIRLERSIRYFYPDFIDEELDTKLADERLTARVTSLSSADHEFANIDDIRSALKAFQ